MRIFTRNILKSTHYALRCDNHLPNVRTCDLSYLFLWMVLGAKITRANFIYIPILIYLQITHSKTSGQNPRRS